MTDVIAHLTERYPPPVEAPWHRCQVEVAPYALVRLSALAWPAPAAASEDFKRCWGALVAAERRLAELAGPLTAALYNSASRHSADFHRRVVLSVRRDVHRGRTPSSRLSSALDDLQTDVPLLRQWLDALAVRDQLRADVGRTAVAALAADRVALAAVAAGEPLRRAVALSSGHLLGGLDRAAALGPEPDRRARKAEAGVLRYALRATTKTSPLSWFTYVAWGSWGQEGSGDDLETVAPVATSRADRVLTESLTRALLGAPGLRAHVPHRLAPALTVADGRVGYRRDVVAGVRRFVISREEQVTLPLTPPLQFVLSQLAAGGSAGITLATLASALTTRSGDGSVPSARSRAYVDRLVSEQLLVPIQPVDPQRDDVLHALASWVDVRGQNELADLLREIEDHSHTFADVSADARTAALAGLSELWESAFTSLGASPLDVPSIREDVVVPRPLTLNRRHGRQALDDVARLAPLTELFDVSAVLHAVVRDQVVTRYGPGGRCGVADLMVDAASLWSSVGRIGPDGTVRPAEGPDQPLPRELSDLAALRRQVVAAVQENAGGDQVEVPEHVVVDTAAALPAWMLRRPASFGYFVQPFHNGTHTGWCVNRIYGGWGRFTSRFLDRLDPSAARAVGAQVRRTLGDTRLVQYRPVVGFNANLHPLLVADEVGEDPAWATLLADELELVHDPDSDQVRLRVARTGQPVDVLYLGFLVPFVLPDRAGPVYWDQGLGRSSLTQLAPRDVTEVDGVPMTRQLRLRYRDLVLARGSWTLAEPTVRAWRGDLERDDDVPAAAAARWTARLGLPSEVFVSGAGDERMADAAEFLRHLDQPKPQYLDLGSALHLRSLPRLLGRYRGGMRIEEALPVPGDGSAGRRAIELLVETYRGRGTSA